jgi:hypothetical protein
MRHREHPGIARGIQRTAMKPTKSILDESFAYTSAAATSVDATWRRYGWQPLTEQERRSRRRRPANGGEGRVVELKPVRSA